MESCATSVAEGMPPRIGGMHIFVWFAALLAVVVLGWADGQGAWLAARFGSPSAIPYETLVLLLLAIGCEFVDATIGMGYGTILTPVLLLLGFPIRQIIPGVVLSQLMGNISASFFHHRVGNADFLRDSKVRNTALVMGGVGMLVAAATVWVSLQISAFLLRAAVAGVLLCLGVFLVIGGRFNLTFRWRNVIGLAFVAAFNKAFTGGGYGPLVCGGQVLVGIHPRSAVAITAVAEALVCLATIGTYVVAGQNVSLTMLLPLTIGSILVTPVSAATLRRLSPTFARRLMGLAVGIMGMVALLKMVL
ncbi:MAG TPA: hypothetical protein DCX07_13865 [Phycisphaerales bacterium]|nr:hypothetical protein [Phycisphaerales bacterium]